MARPYDVSEFRWSALARYHDRCLEAAIGLDAFSRLKIHSHFDMQIDDGPRMAVRMITDIHDFAVNARKAIEVSEEFKTGALEAAKSVKLKSSGQWFETELGDGVMMVDQPFWWVICRLVHSRETLVVEQITELDATQNRIYSERRSRFFAFRSDYDSSDSINHIEIEALTASYRGTIGPLVEQAISARLGN